MSEHIKSPVPKFGSFKPRKPTSKPDTFQENDPGRGDSRRGVKLGKHRVEEPKPTRDRSRRRSQSFHPITDHYNPEHHKARNKRHHNRRRDGNDEADDLELSATYPDRYAREVFFIDTKGDPANRQYRTSNKWAVPKYRLYGNGSIVGLDPEIKIDGKSSDQSSYTLTYPSKTRLARVIEPVGFDERFQHAAADDEPGDGSNHDDDDEEVDAIKGGEARDVEMNFVSLPVEEKNDKKYTMPIVTPKV